MVKDLRPIPFTEFAGDVAGFFERIIDNHETVLVEKERGKIVMLRRARRARPRGKAKAPDRDAFLSTAGGWKDLVDIDKLVEGIYESRSIISRPPVNL